MLYLKLAIFLALVSYLGWRFYRRQRRRRCIEQLRETADEAPSPSWRRRTPR